jgi:HEAT repeat protein
MLEILNRWKEAKAVYSEITMLMAGRAGRCDSLETLNGLLHFLRASPDIYAVMIASHILDRFADDKIADEIISILKHAGENWRRRYCINTLGFLKASKAADLLLSCLSDINTIIRSSTATALGRIGSEKAVASLIDVLSDNYSGVRSSARIALIHIAAEAAISQLDRVIDRIFENLRDVEQIYLPSIARSMFKAAFRSAELKIIGAVLANAKKYLALDAYFYLPYEIAFEYIKSNADPAILDRQHPEMRDAVQLLIDLHRQGPAQPGNEKDR